MIERQISLTGVDGVDDVDGVENNSPGEEK